MRQAKLSVVLATVRAQTATVLGPKANQLKASTLLLVSQDMGLVDGVRGRGGGYEVTDEGLKFININVEEFKLAEAAAAVKQDEQAKEAKRQAQKQRIAALEASLASVSTATAIIANVSPPAHMVAAQEPTKRSHKKQKQVE